LTAAGSVSEDLGVLTGASPYRDEVVWCLCVRFSLSAASAGLNIYQ
jgi:hypothetical protein